MTNNIEGVHSTRREIDDILSDLEVKSKKDRFHHAVVQFSGNLLPLFIGQRTGFYIISNAALKAGPARKAPENPAPRPGPIRRDR